MSNLTGILVFSEAAPSGDVNYNPTMGNWMWFKPSTGKWYKRIDSSWVETEAPAHLHPTLGDINFTGSVSVGGAEGIDLDVSGKIEITRLKIEKGIITALEYET